MDIVIERKTGNTWIKCNPTGNVGKIHSVSDFFDSPMHFSLMKRCWDCSSKESILSTTSDLCDLLPYVLGRISHLNQIRQLDQMFRSGILYMDTPEIQS